MADQPPPNRFAVIERGGRLVVIDLRTGATPPSAAERMAEHDKRRGHEAIRPDLPEPSSQSQVRPAPPPKTIAAPPASLRDAKRAADAAKRSAAKRADTNRQPWGEEKSRPTADASSTQYVRAKETANRPAVGRGRKRIVTAKWWDSKGPRSIELGPRGQQLLSGSFIPLFLVVLVAAIAALVIQPLLLLIGAFLIFQFGDKLLGPIGAGIVDKAVAERD